MTKKHWNEVSLTTEARDIIIGSLFGDGWCGAPGTRTTPYLSFGHKWADFEYLTWKRDVLAETGLYCTHFRYTCNDGRITSAKFDTQSHPILFPFWEQFYHNRIKVVLPESLAQLSPQSLAVWYMDDGSLHYRYPYNNVDEVHFATHAFTVVENDTIQQCLLDKYHICSRLSWQGRYTSKPLCHIVIGRRLDQIRLFDIIGNYIHPCMERKLWKRPIQK